MASWTNITPVRWWCQKVLPCVYDDSLSYYEVLCKFSSKLNEVIEVVNAQGSGIAGYVQELMDQYKVQWEQELDVVLNSFKNDVDKTLDSYNDTLIAYNEKINNQNVEIAQFKASIVQQIATLTALIKTTDDTNRSWTLSQIEKAINNVATKFPMLIDPTDGKLEDIQTVINHLYDFSRTNALTAQEYDNLQLTAQEYDNKQLTAIQYDQAGKLLLTEG